MINTSETARWHAQIDRRMACSDLNAAHASSNSSVTSSTTHKALTPQVFTPSITAH